MDKESYKEQLDEYYDSFQEEFIDIANELEDDYRENVADKDRKKLHAVQKRQIFLHVCITRRNSIKDRCSITTKTSTINGLF